MLHQILNGRLLGHPIHPMLVHFPTALFTSGFIFDVTALYTSNEIFLYASFYSILLGLAGGVSAGVFGFIDYLKLTDLDRAFRKASWHAGLQMVVITVFALLAGLRYQHYPELGYPETIEIVVSGAALLVMVIANYLGGDLVFRDGIGVDPDHARQERSG